MADCRCAGVASVRRAAAHVRRRDGKPNEVGRTDESKWNVQTSCYQRCGTAQKGNRRLEERRHGSGRCSAMQGKNAHCGDGSSLPRACKRCWIDPHKESGKPGFAHAPTKTLRCPRPAQNRSAPPPAPSSPWGPLRPLQQRGASLLGTDLRHANAMSSSSGSKVRSEGRFQPHRASGGVQLGGLGPPGRATARARPPSRRRLPRPHPPLPQRRPPPPTPPGAEAGALFRCGAPGARVRGGAQEGAAGPNGGAGR